MNTNEPPTTPMKTRELTGQTLDLAVAMCEGYEPSFDGVELMLKRDGERHKSLQVYSPSTSWALGGPIVEREGIAVCMPNEKGWLARDFLYINHLPGRTPLIAAMRIYVLSKLGDEIDIPDIADLVRGSPSTINAEVCVARASFGAAR